jgi:hypothetical protein
MLTFQVVNVAVSSLFNDEENQRGRRHGYPRQAPILTAGLSTFGYPRQALR